MKKKLQSVFLLLLLIAAVPIVVQATIQQQRAQIGISITVFVTPAPIAMNGSSAASDTTTNGIVAKLSVNKGENPGHFSAESLAFSSGELVAQTTNQQKAVRVEASVAPNPLGTLLFSNVTGVSFTQTAGTTVRHSCAYTVTVDTAISNWSLDHGLFSDMSSGSGSFTGHDIANNSYLSTPLPTATPFIVFSNGQNWTLLQANGGMKTYCVDLTITVPATTTQGTYSSNAVYTLLY